MVKNNNISDDKIVFQMKNENNIDIVGGGPAGLSVGYFAKKEGLEVKIYEASGTVGGNCKTIIDGEFRYDSGAHRLHDKSEYVTNEIKLLLGDKLKRVTSPSKIYYKGTFFNFPISVSDLIYKLDLSLLIKIIYDNILLRLRKRPSPKSFKQVAYQSYGKTISKMFLISYTEKLWGDDADNLDPTISGGRLKVLNLRSLMKDLFAIKKTDSDHLEGAFYYPELGFGEIFNALGAKIGPANIFLNKKVCNVYHDNIKILSFTDNSGENNLVNNLVYTAPIDELVKSLSPAPPKHILDKLQFIKYRELMICVIYLDLKKFSSNASIYFPDSKCPFTRIYEPKNRSTKMSPIEKTCIVVEVPMGARNVKISSSKEVVYNKVLDYLENKSLINKENIIGYKLVKIKSAYPIITLGSVLHIKEIRKYLARFSNLKMIGRNSSFEYLHTHNIMERSRSLINKMVS